MKIQLRYLTALFVLSAVFSHFSCITSGNIDAASPPAGRLDGSATYIIKDSILILTSLPNTHFYTYCDGNTLKSQKESSEVITDTVQYLVSKNIFSISYSKFYPSSLANVKFTNTYNRQGGGTTLLGTWIFTHEDYVILNGSLDSADKISADKSISLLNNKVLNGAIITIVFTATKSDSYYLRAPIFAERFIMDFNAAKFHGTVTKVDHNTVQLVGNISHEVVTISENTNLEIIYTSSDTTHKTFTFSEVPKSCPDIYRPDWYAIFLDANPKVMTAP